MTACPIRYQRQVPDRKGKIFYTSITSLSHISKCGGICIKCQACVKGCPTGAKYFADAAFCSHRAMLEQTYAKRRENEFFPPL